MNISGASYVASTIYHQDNQPSWAKVENHSFCEFLSKIVSKFVR